MPEADVAKSILRKLAAVDCTLQEAHNEICDGFFLGLDYNATENLTPDEVALWREVTGQ